MCYRLIHKTLAHNQVISYVGPRDTDQDSSIWLRIYSQLTDIPNLPICLPSTLCYRHPYMIFMIRKYHDHQECRNTKRQLVVIGVFGLLLWYWGAFSALLVRDGKDHHHRFFQPHCFRRRMTVISSTTSSFISSVEPEKFYKVSLYSNRFITVLRASTTSSWSCPSGVIRAILSCERIWLQPNHFSYRIQSNRKKIMLPITQAPAPYGCGILVLISPYFHGDWRMMIKSPCAHHSLPKNPNSVGWPHNQVVPEEESNLG